MGNRALVLVVEDDPDIRDIVTQVLAAEGYSVQTAEHGAAALHSVLESEGAIDAVQGSGRAPR
jgi:CheY-like chemotaxis protein